MKELFKVIKTGLLTTFQDIGRHGYQQYGVVTSGAMDSYSFQLANLLVGNNRNEVCLEMSMLGPTLLVEAEEALIAICGGDLSPTINGKPALMWQSFKVFKGDKITFGKPISGVWAYLSVAGGFNIKPVLGSKSFYGKARIGTSISKGDIIYGSPTLNKTKGLSWNLRPVFKNDVTVHVILGPHKDAFTELSIERFFSEPFQVVQGDRMGYRLKGNYLLEHKSSADIASDAIPLGGIQVPSSGQPIILLADRQTTGGYTRIGTVISVDIAKIAQVPPGGTITFKQITVEDAHDLYFKREMFLARFEKLSGLLS